MRGSERVKKSKNMMNMIPVRKKNIEWTKDGEIVTLIIKRNSKIDIFMHKLFRTSNIRTVELEKIGSFIWEQCDAKTNLYEISCKLENKFGKEAEPVIPRMLQYIKILSNNNFINLK